MRKIITIIAAATFVFLPMAVQTTSAVSDMCFKVYEDSGNNGDRWEICNTPSNMHISDLSHYTTNLVNGCASKYAFRTGWNDCISSIRWTALPANYRIVGYEGSSYTAGRSFCADLDGTHAAFSVAADDETSSWRVEGGNC